MEILEILTDLNGPRRSFKALLRFGSFLDLKTAVRVAAGIAST